MHQIILAPHIEKADSKYDVGHDENCFSFTRILKYSVAKRIRKINHARIVLKSTLGVQFAMQLFLEINDSTHQLANADVVSTPPLMNHWFRVINLLLMAKFCAIKNMPYPHLCKSILRREY